MGDIIALFQMGPKTGKPFLTEISDKIITSCGPRVQRRITGLTMVRETADYLVVSGEIVKVVGYCQGANEMSLCLYFSRHFLGLCAHALPLHHQRAGRPNQGGRGRGLRFIFLLLNFDNRYVNKLTEDLAKRCPGGRRGHPHKD